MLDKKPPGKKAGAPAWMVTYGDLVTLLMCFFVLLFAFSEIDAQKFEQVMQSFQGSAGVLESGKSLSEDELIFDASPETDTTPDTIDSEPLDIVEEALQEAVEEIAEALKEKFEGKEFEADIEVVLVENKIIIRLKNNVLFDPAKAEIKPEALEILTTIGEVLQGEIFTDSEIRIEGHTDNVPMKTVRFPSNWELSAGRATSVLNYFVRELDFSQDRLSIAGHAEFRPIATNDTAIGRSENRRVEIIIEKFNVENVIEDELEEEGETQQ